MVCTVSCTFWIPAVRSLNNNQRGYRRLLLSAPAAVLLLSGLVGSYYDKRLKKTCVRVVLLSFYAQRNRWHQTSSSSVKWPTSICWWFCRYSPEDYCVVRFVLLSFYAKRNLQTPKCETSEDYCCTCCLFWHQNVKGPEDYCVVKFELLSFYTKRNLQTPKCETPEDYCCTVVFLRSAKSLTPGC